MDWFERLMGFPETTYAETRGRLSIEDGALRSQVNGRTFGIGNLEVVSLEALRQRVAANHGAPGRLTVRTISRVRKNPSV
ncbi:hypothetical protein FBZ89_12638 [Nitrospirillum amazonense]|uniref:Uncharacterized protein n=1 Tax=Nitrospirillum amazonense TaxID=28077 RepID=A0A560ESA8_9PROT|nr:hypothetical protein [Nitrospirillum amazonense]TWB12260.1 hypothetical protein FBZ89_12638 [Nitrospirillum amazonense]